jgi:hypothetical protein
MRALDNAVAAALEALGAGAVYYPTAPRDTPPPYYVHRSTDSRPGGGTGFGGGEAREYEHSIVAVARDPDTAEDLREAVIEAFRGRTLAVDGWGTSQKITWQGEVHDPGDLLPGGTIGYEAGDCFKIPISRAT